LHRDSHPLLYFSSFYSSIKQAAIQLCLRVLDPRFIQQRQEQIGGVNAYVHNITLFNPLQYVEIVGALAEKGVVANIIVFYSDKLISKRRSVSLLRPTWFSFAVHRAKDACQFLSSSKSTSACGMASLHAHDWSIIYHID
jgi:hypothetical protein